MGKKLVVPLHQNKRTKQYTIVLPKKQFPFLKEKEARFIKLNIKKEDLL